MWRDFERYARGGDTRGEGKNEVRLRTVRENHEERKKWDTWRVPKEKTQRTKIEARVRTTSARRHTRKEKCDTSYNRTAGARDTRGAKKQARVKTVSARTHTRRES